MTPTEYDANELRTAMKVCIPHVTSYCSTAGAAIRSVQSDLRVTMGRSTVLSMQPSQPTRVILSSSAPAITPHPHGYDIALCIA